MVLKLCLFNKARKSLFESSVNSDGTQTSVHRRICALLFESSVNSDGTQTENLTAAFLAAFESRVNFNSYQTNLFLGNRK